jgi:hypothetical protein
MRAVSEIADIPGPPTVAGPASKAASRYSCPRWVWCSQGGLGGRGDEGVGGPGIGYPNSETALEDRSLTVAARR